MIIINKQWVNMKNIILSIVFATSLLGIAAQSYASQPDIEIQIKIHKGRFIPSEIKIPADTKVKLLIENLDDTPEEFDSYDLNREVLIQANGKGSCYIGPLSPGRYKFEGEFSPETAQGVVIVK